MTPADGGAAGADEAIVERFGTLLSGQKNECPVCGKRVMWQSYQNLFGSGLGQHIRAAHPEYEKRVRAASNRRKKELAAEEAAAKAEALARPLRAHLVAGAFLDEVASELSSLIQMMEGYYTQGGCDEHAQELIERIEAMHRDAAAKP